jgi:RIO kinase 2
MPLTILNSFRKLSQFDFRLLSVVEILMAKYEIVPIEEIAHYLHYTEKKIRKELEKLKQYKLIFMVQRHYFGVALTFIGYDALALKALVEKGTVANIGPEIGAGKESNIHLAVDDNGHEFLLKFHRLGKLDFRATRKSRAFIAEKRHISPLYESRLSAKREYKALSELFSSDVSVPQPITQNRHILAMEIVTGKDLYRIKKNEFLSDNAIIQLFNNILYEVKRAVNLGYIHGDLSEYNIRLNEENYPVLFDWPQYIELGTESAGTILERDVQNIINYFRKKFQMKLKINVSEIIEDYLKNS